MCVSYCFWSCRMLRGPGMKSYDVCPIVALIGCANVVVA